ncbi:hypothetical protein ACIBG8_19360 [Nonomuraea sp. NPDC050556]|uniref:hypothetical protein n=1 Tax=Nonomuraea sp. NPDC050556 TaxID=3364369 RepID=UPI0037A3CFE0
MERNQLTGEEITQAIQIWDYDSRITEIEVKNFGLGFYAKTTIQVSPEQLTELIDLLATRYNRLVDDGQADTEKYRL